MRPLRGLDLSIDEDPLLTRRLHALLSSFASHLRWALQVQGVLAGSRSEPTLVDDWIT